MKYYIYISETKIDMLLSQIPHDVKKKLATEYKLDFKLLSASRKVETEKENNLIAKLETVCNFIREFGNVGSVNEPDEYIEDTLIMKWVYAGHVPRYVYFSAKVGKTIFGLGGSSHHLLGQNRSKGEDVESTVSRSLAPFIIDALRLTVGDDKGQVLVPEYKQTKVDLHEPLFLMLQASSLKGGLEQRVEFLAKRLRQWDSPDGRLVLLLASPLYVALAE